jgi:hypothetical protein
MERPCVVIQRAAVVRIRSVSEDRAVKEVNPAGAYAKHQPAGTIRLPRKGRRKEARMSEKRERADEIVQVAVNLKIKCRDAIRINGQSDDFRPAR